MVTADPLEEADVQRVASIELLRGEHRRRDEQRGANQQEPARQTVLTSQT